MDITTAAEMREIAQRIVAHPRTITTYSDDPAERYDVVRSAARLAELVLVRDEQRARPNPQTLTRFDADGARDPWANDPDRTTRREAPGVQR